LLRDRRVRQASLMEETRHLALSVALLVAVSCTSTPEVGTPAPGGGISGCEAPSAAWLDTLASSFFAEYVGAPIKRAAYVDIETTDGTDAFYVAVELAGVSGIAVFGTSKPPVRSDPGLIAAANATAEELTDLGADIKPNSPVGLLLKDFNGVTMAQACLPSPAS
jgi:hypothetical protein